MIFIPHHAEWIEVESAFGRFSINKLKALFKKSWQLFRIK
jgi:hypothetical protein